LPQLIVIASTTTSGERRATSSDTQSSPAVSVSMMRRTMISGE